MKHRSSHTSSTVLSAQPELCFHARRRAAPGSKRPPPPCSAVPAGHPQPSPPAPGRHWRAPSRPGAPPPPRRPRAAAPPRPSPTARPRRRPRPPAAPCGPSAGCRWSCCATSCRAWCAVAAGGAGGGSTGDSGAGGCSRVGSCMQCPLHAQHPVMRKAATLELRHIAPPRASLPRSRTAPGW